MIATGTHGYGGSDGCALGHSEVVVSVTGEGGGFDFDFDSMSIVVI